MDSPNYTTPTTLDNFGTRIGNAYTYARWAEGNTPLRYGQAWYNALPNDLAGLLTGTQYDPFYRGTEAVADAENYLCDLFLKD